MEEPIPPRLEDEYIFASRRLVMYQDLNAAGRLFGGQLMAWVDEGVAMIAVRIMGTKSIVTKKFGEVVFDHPGKLGDSVEIWCRPTREGRTSLTVEARMLVRSVAPERLHQICRSTIVYVSLDARGRPTPWRKPAHGRALPPGRPPRTDPIATSRSSPRTPRRTRGPRA